MNYFKGRDNLACTIFIPVKCGNSCPFCNTKQMYENYNFSTDHIAKIKEVIRKINNSKYVTEFVITGGEPLFNPTVLKELVNEMNKPVFINTSLPNIPEIEKTIDWINNEDKIKSISISRHIGFTHDIKVCDKEIVDKIKKLVRINTVIHPSQLDEIIPFFNYWKSPYRMVNLRADYRFITQLNLKDRDTISNFLLDNFIWEYTNGCLVCNSEVYSDNEHVICYHRGLEHSSVITKIGCYINDVLVDMYGNIYKDWDMQEDKEFENWLFNE